jgi:predicted nucleotidyltransferase component of viral defense system
VIDNAVQLKAKVRNVSKGEDKAAKTYIRIFFMERFMERLSLSRYRDEFVLKGGMLISSLLGINDRATKDIDTTVKALPLKEEKITEILEEIFSIDLEDNVTFHINSVETIMEDFDYPGIRVHFEAYMDRLRQSLKIDISTDDVITPKAIEYDYKLLFEERKIKLITYNIETTLAEKVQSILHRGLANTRMRDYYDVFELIEYTDFSWDTVCDAFKATCEKRKTVFSIDDVEKIMMDVSESPDLEKMWNLYKEKNYYVGDIEFSDVMEGVNETIKKIVH